MAQTAVFIAAFILLPAVGLVAWAWFTMDRVEEDMRSLSGFEGRHFEIGPWASEYTKGTSRDREASFPDTRLISAP